MPGRSLPSLLSAAALLLACAQAAYVQTTPHASTDEEPVLPWLHKDVQALLPLVQAPWVKAFLEATAELPRVPPRRVYELDASHFYTEAEAEALPADRRDKLRRREISEAYYYTTKYGSPLSYARALDLLAQAGVLDVHGKRVLDFGYGYITHLRLLASLGADVTGVDVDPLLPAVYSQPGDQGAIEGRSGRSGRLTLLSGRFPHDEAVKGEVGADYDLILSKNVLKRGYIHPQRPVPDRQRIDLGVPDEVFIRTLYETLRPGGHLIIYNLHPAQTPPHLPYLPMADGGNPFPRSQWEAAGFRVLAFDRDDTAFARKMGRALEWHLESPPMDLDKDLFATFSILKRP